jgi:hypothetical protein
LITPKTKGEILERVEELRRAVKKARQRANGEDLPEGPRLEKVGQRLLNYVFTGEK